MYSVNNPLDRNCCGGSWDGAMPGVINSMYLRWNGIGLVGVDLIPPGGGNNNRIGSRRVARIFGMDRYDPSINSRHRNLGDTG